MGFTENLNGEDSLNMVLLDEYFFSKNPNYLEDKMPSAKLCYESICNLSSAKKFDSQECIALTNMYNGFKQYYLAQFLYLPIIL